MATKNSKNSKNESMNMSAANGNNTLRFTTYTSENTGKTIPVVYGFTGKEDERLPYIAVLEQPKAKKGQKVQRVHGPAYGTYSRLPLGKDGERISCVIWGADPRWHDIAKRAAEIINDLDALTQEDYDDLCAKAEAVYEAKKAESRPTPDPSRDGGEKAGAKKVEPKGSTKPAKAQEPKQDKPKAEKPKSQPNGKAKSEKSKGAKKGDVRGSSLPSRGDLEGSAELTLTATKPAPTYTEAALMAAFAEVAKATKVSKKSRTALENFMKAIIAKAKAA